MSALARFFSQQGSTVLGYDKTATDLTKKLESEGIKGAREKIEKT